MPATLVDVVEPDIDAYRLTHIREFAHPAFETAYALLWQEFGAKNEMETRDVLRARFALAPEAIYELVLLEDPSGAWAAVCDYTLMPSTNARHDIAVHLSHTLVAPGHRRAGLPLKLLQFAATRAKALRPDAPGITMLAEVEHDDGLDPLRAIRLAAFEKAGLLKVDPARIDYHQPDFSAPKALNDPRPAVPLPLLLLLKRIGREQDREIRGDELRSLVSRLYAMYGAQFRPQDMAHPALDLARYPADDEGIALLPPTRPDR
jgi:GNAT superfamily N-acetyltransferase